MVDGAQGRRRVFFYIHTVGIIDISFHYSYFESIEKMRYTFVHTNEGKTYLVQLYLPCGCSRHGKLNSTSCVGLRRTPYCIEPYQRPDFDSIFFLENSNSYCEEGVEPSGGNAGGLHSQQATSVSGYLYV